MRNKHPLTKIIVFFVFFIFSAISITADSDNVPENLIETANNFIENRIGEDFFNNYIAYLNGTYEPEYTVAPISVRSPDTSTLKEGYVLRYNFKMKDFIDEDFDLFVDLEGEIYGDKIALPDCSSNPEECDFPIDEAQAIQTAQDAGLEEGIGEWKTSFHWYYGNLRTFVWTISNTLGANYGETVLIDANDGEIYSTSNWESLADTVIIGNPTDSSEEIDEVTIPEAPIQGDVNSKKNDEGAMETINEDPNFITRLLNWIKSLFK